MCNIVYQATGTYVYMKYFLDLQHGIGTPSLVVIMHEVFKLLHYAEAEEVKFFRIGTSGGLGTD